VRPIILIGAGGHCASCIEAIESTGEWEITGLVDKQERIGARLLGYEVMGNDSGLSELAQRFGAALITVGQIESSTLRRRLFLAARSSGFELPVITASTARVSRYANIGYGTIVLHHAFVNAGAQVGENCILNTGTIIEHDAVVGGNCHVSTGAIVNGDCIIGDGSFIGSGAVLRNGICLVAGCVVGAGAVVTKDLHEAGIYVGCPARRKE